MLTPPQAGRHRRPARCGPLDAAGFWPVHQAGRIRAGELRDDSTRPGIVRSGATVRSSVRGSRLPPAAVVGWVAVLRGLRPVRCTPVWSSTASTSTRPYASGHRPTPARHAHRVHLRTRESGPSNPVCSPENTSSLGFHRAAGFAEIGTSRASRSPPRRGMAGRGPHRTLQPRSSPDPTRPPLADQLHHRRFSTR